MNAFDEQSRSFLWMDTVVATAPALTDNKRADTVVVGSGIAGLSTAYELSVPRPESRCAGSRPYRWGHDLSNQRPPDLTI